MPKLTPCILTLDPATIRYEEARDVATLGNKVWPRDGFNPDAAAREMLSKQQQGVYTRGEHQWYIIRELATGKLIAYANTFPRTIAVNKQPMTILALAGVCSHPDFRGQGLGAAVVRAAFARIDQHAFPFSLFQTTDEYRGFYEHLGAAVIRNRIVNSLSDKPDAYPFWDETAMAYPATRPFPPGTIDLLGPGY